VSALAVSADDEQEDEGPRLHSRGYVDRVPLDVIAEQHLGVHALLIRWGLWSGSRGSASLASVEVFSTGKGGTPASTAPMSADPQIMAVERAVLRMPTQHRSTVRMLYVQRLTVLSICKAMHLRYEGWEPWIYTARCMVVNLLRRNGAGPTQP